MESLPFGQQDSCIVTDEQQYITSGQNTWRTSRYDSNKGQEVG